MNAMQLWKGALVVALMAAVLATAGTAMAATIVQDAGADHLAFEAESFDSLNDIGSDGVNWVVISDAGASGGEAIQAPAVVDFANEGETIYNLEFTKPTDFYRVYARYKILVGVNSDSFLTPNDEPSSSTNPLSRWFGGPADQGRSLGNDPTHGTAGTYAYAFLGNTGAVTAGTYEFRLGIREREAELDRIIFVDSSSGGPVNGIVGNGRAEPVGVLDGLVNSTIVVPEPTSLGLLALGMLAITGMMRRQG